MSEPTSRAVSIFSKIADIDSASWDAAANPDPARYDPFVSHAFLAALESSGSVGRGTGWSPAHLALEDRTGGIAGVMPLYSKTHSQGEYVFDHAWAEVLRRVGIPYYPKLQSAVPFTPVPGRRLLIRPDVDEAEAVTCLAAAGIEIATQNGMSSLHVTFLSDPECRLLEPLGFLTRTGIQYHWTNAGYGSFDDFLATLSSRKRKALRRERADALTGGLTIERITGRDITEAHWDAMFQFYMDTGNRKWGRPYLNRAFFSRLGEAMAERCLLVFASNHGRAVAGALNIIGGDCLYGRYWGALEHVPFLHFEVCYYQAMEYAIAHGLRRVEAGAQGEHKLARGYAPVTTYSSHWIADPRLRAAVARFLDAERQEMAEAEIALANMGPYKKETG